MDTPHRAGHREHSFARTLFFGEIDEEQVFPFPDALDDEQKQTLEVLLEPVRKFMETRVDGHAIDEAEAIPPDLLEGLKELGVFGLQIPEEHGGLGLSNTAYARVFETISAHNASIAVTLGAHQSIGLKGILLFGTPEQQAKYLPALATGENVAAFALTEPTSGSDAASIRSRAVPTADGEHYVLNGGKIWISNGGFAEIFTVFAQVPVVQDDGTTKDRVTAFIVERAFGGVTHGPPERKLGIKGSNTVSLYFEDVKIPRANVLGEVGGGFKVAMTILNNGRFGLAAGSVGGMKRIIKAAAEHARTRKQFGKTLSEFGLIQEKFAKMAIKAYVAESMTYMTCGLMDRGAADYALEAAMCKVYASEANWETVNEALQVMGGLGYMKEYPFERFLRDSRISMIFEGTNEILRLFIALSGIQGPGDHLRDLMRAVRDPLQNYGMILTEIAERVRHRVTGEHIERAHPKLKRAAVHVEEQVVAFGQTVEALLRKHGKQIIDEQMLLRRVADVAIHLYGMIAVISRATRSLERGAARAEHEAQLTLAFCDEAERLIRRELRAIELGKKNGDRELAKLAEDVFAEGAYLPEHPLGL